MLARSASADVIVVGLIGERGREVRDFVERDLGAVGLARSVVVVATGDEPPLVRVRAAMAATAVAEHFRSRGKRVLLLLDSLSRVAMAQREIGLAAGEPPTSRGYPPSVFALLPKLIERAGNDAGAGSITALYTVLAEGDDTTDPVVDASRAALDGHIMLSRKLANGGHYPAVDVLSSVSRVMNDVIDPNHRLLAREGREVLAAYRESADLIEVGAYVAGTNPRVDRAIRCIAALNGFLRQDPEQRFSMGETMGGLRAALETAAVREEARRV
jgi:flagellum-specific ATP synthase